MPMGLCERVLADQLDGHRLFGLEMHCQLDLAKLSLAQGPGESVRPKAAAGRGGL